MQKFSFFKNAFTDKPDGGFNLEQFIELVKNGTWAPMINKLRGSSETFYKRIKGKLPAVTISGEFHTRDKKLPLEKRLKVHTGLICLDIDKKDNPRMRVKDIIDPDAIAEFVSAGGEGKKVIYQCTPVKTADEHRRIFDACVDRLKKKGIEIKVDPIVKNIAGLQYVSFDPNARFNAKTKLIIKPAPPVKHKKILAGDVSAELAQLNEYIQYLGKKDVTSSYENWMLIMFGLSHSLGELGREPLHKLCKNYPKYSKAECDEKYDSFLSLPAEQVSKPVTLNTVFLIINEHLPKRVRKILGKKYSVTHSVGEVEEGEEIVEQGDLMGLVRYKLFLFKKIVDKETSTISELKIHKLNLNALEETLNKLGFYRFRNVRVNYVRVVNNIVESCDVPDILRIMTEHIISSGDYNFAYKKTVYNFPVEEIAHAWRECRASSTMHNQIASSLKHWEPNLLKDLPTESFIPYRNAVVSVTKDKITLIPYNKLQAQVWKERILPRDFKLDNTRGMFEQFFINVMGREGKLLKHPNYTRSLWYYGYMLQGNKRQSTARAWLLYDIKAGNNGRTGKTIIGSAIGKIRSVTVIDGKQVDLRNRFWLQTIQPWTDVVFIDDPSKYTSLAPLFNMISGQTNADKKGVDPIVKDDVKFMFASNWILESAGQSEAGRQFVSQLDDYYVRYSKQHGNTITPIVHAHGKEFFTDWDTKDWAQFDTFSARAIQYHLKQPAPDNMIIGNSSQVRFIQLHEEEMFHSLCMALVEYAKESSGGWIVPQGVLANVIKECNADLKANKAGRIAREFLTAVGAFNISITSTRVGGQVRQAYFFNGPLDFGQNNYLLKGTKLGTT